MRRNGRAGRKRPTHALSGSAGSSPVLRDNAEYGRINRLDLRNRTVIFCRFESGFRAITERSAVGSAPALGAGCRVFKSPRSDQQNRKGKAFAEDLPSGKATVFDAVIRRFKSGILCHGRSGRETFPPLCGLYGTGRSPPFSGTA